MKSLMQLLGFVLSDAEDACRASTIRDRQTISERVENEGLSFLTITLPAFCSDFERSLADGRIAPGSFPSFRKRGLSPVFLRGLLGLVFDTKSGTLLDEPDVSAIFFIRQITLLFKKLLSPCSDTRVAKAYSGFIQCEKELRHVEDDLAGTPKLSAFESLANLIWTPVFSGAQALVNSGDHIPRHGPGATAERISGNRKYDLKTWHSRLEPYFPLSSFSLRRQNEQLYLPHVFMNELQYGSEDPIEVLDPGQEPPVRVITVPKTLKTPRIIAIEPVCVQYTQQALLELLVPAIEQHKLTSGSVNFTDQTVNRKLCQSSSKDGKFATLDLSEASDRVLCSLVSTMLSGVPLLRDAILACRSSRADVPGFGVTPLVKFASMGSALCFPMESCVFYTLILQAMLNAKGLSYSTSSVLKMKRLVRVYGDDLIIPVDMVQPVTEHLHSFGLKVNHRKSFGTGKFRESCGMDAYDGYEVTPSYCRRICPTSRRDSEALVSWIELSNSFFMKGLWKSADFLRRTCEAITGPLPFVGPEAGVLGLSHFRKSLRTFHAWNKDLHCFMQRGPVLRPRHRNSSVTGHGALLKYFLKRGEEPFLDVKHLTRGGRPLSVDMKIGRAALR